ncbi:hypothetical protein FAIPA1_10493 [Frankia sp. AiPs1]
MSAAAPRCLCNQAIDGTATIKGIGHCGTAAHRREPVIVTDIAAEPFRDDFRNLAERAGCWSAPLLCPRSADLITVLRQCRTPAG